MTIQVTERATNHFLKHKENNKPFLKLNLKKSGCSGFKYSLDWVNSPNDDDREIELINDKLTLLYSKSNEKVLNNLMIDYGQPNQNNDINQQVLFHNPNEKNQCGCGLSVNFD